MTLTETITKALAKVNLKDDKSIQEAANAIFEDTTIKVGDEVYSIDEPGPQGNVGVRGRVVSDSRKVGWMTVEMDNGARTECIASLLIKAN